MTNEIETNKISHEDEKPKRKKMSITARVGNLTKTVTFPIPDEFEAWMCKIKHLDAIEVEGNKSVKMRLTISTYNENY